MRQIRVFGLNLNFGTGFGFWDRFLIRTGLGFENYLSFRDRFGFWDRSVFDPIYVSEQIYVLG